MSTAKSVGIGASTSSQKVKNGDSDKQKKQALSSDLKRTTFKTSREMDFFSEKELVTQTGHEIHEWPLVILKELIDNALDACEEAGIAPAITVAADSTGITVADNGPGLPAPTLKAALDFTVRASSREAYVAPDRGAQGNALKTILTMPFVLDPDGGKLVVVAHGQRHVITCGADPVTQRAVVNDGATEQLSSGTEIRVAWALRDGVALWPFGDLDPHEVYWRSSFLDRFRSVIDGFALFNPHVQFTLDWFGDETTWNATNIDWEKWRASKPTSAHWYEAPHLERLVGAYIAHDRDTDRDRLVSDFVAEFDGLSASRKRSAVLSDAGLKRAALSSLVVDGKFDHERIDTLLQAMQNHTRPIKSKRLGVIGEEHFRERLLSMGVQPESFQYSKRLGKDGVPWVLEAAFGWLGDMSVATHKRKIFSGVNWSASIKNPFRSFGQSSEGLEAELADKKVGQSEPVIFAIHLAHPRVEYTDRGKSAMVITS